MKIDNFFAELKRRNVYKVAIAYAVVAWLLIQAASIFLPAFNAPQWAMQIVILILVVGFPIALVFSWAFEITPEGIKRESEVAADESITHHTGRKIVALTIVLAVIATGLLIFQFLRARTWPERQSNGSTSPSVATISNKSIAVLPFDNLSGDPQNAYFSEGVQDEILTRLAKIAELKVISRTATQRFKSAPNDLRQIARTVAETLRAKLTGTAERVLASRPTENPEAHQLYLKGRFYGSKRTAKDAQKSIEYFQQAAAIDPNYALAYAGLAEANWFLALYSYPQVNEVVPKARELALKALELDNSLAEPHSILGVICLNYDRDFACMERETKLAIELNPNYSEGHRRYGLLLQNLGRFEEAGIATRRALELDPLSPVINQQLAG